MRCSDTVRRAGRIRILIKSDSPVGIIGLIFQKIVYCYFSALVIKELKSILIAGALIIELRKGVKNYKTLKDESCNGYFRYNIGNSL